MANTERQMHQHSEPGYETRDAKWQVIAKWLAALALATIATVYLLWVLFISLERSRPAEPGRGVVARNTALPPEPRLQLSPREDMERMRAEEDAILHSYGWIDKNQGRVRIPIEHAMALVLEQGLPQRENTASTARDQLTSFAADSASGRFIERRPTWLEK